MTYQTQSETPTATITQPANGATYTLGQSDGTTAANYSCSAVSTASGSAVGPYLTVASCNASDTPGGTVANGSQFDTGTLGPHTFTVQVQDSATNTSQQTATYTVVSPPAISGASSATFAVGTPASVIFSATGYPVPSFTESGSMPAGVTFVDNKNGAATLGGTATVSGIFPITITAQNGAVSPATLAFTLTAVATAPAKLVISNASVGGNLQVNGGTFSIGPGVTIKGNFSMVEAAKSTLQSQLCGVSIGGNLQVQESGTPITIGSSSLSCPGNTVTGNLTVSDNSATTAIYNNTVGGSLTDQQNSKPTQVFFNHIAGTLSCSNDTSITGGGNTAIKKLGQCSKF